MIGGFQVGPFQRAYQQHAPASQQQNSGGWPMFAYAYEREQQRRRHARKKELELADETQHIQDKLDRQIAVELRRRERETERAAELSRLKAMATQLETAEARREYGERVAKALERALEKGNYSALEALDRELQRAQEEADFMLLAAAIILEDE